MELCRYTGLPLGGCNCSEGCETSQVEPGEWIQPVMEGYRMTCCDCGLVHLLDFRIVDGKIQLRAFREMVDGK